VDKWLSKKDICAASVTTEATAITQGRADATPGPIPSPLSYDITVVDHLVSRV
jgi:hypothetical protein